MNQDNMNSNNMNQNNMYQSNMNPSTQGFSQGYQYQNTDTQGNINETGNPSLYQQGTYVVSERKEFINDNELLKAYIGKNYDKITRRPFNFAASFLGMLYLLYRKKVLWAILVWAINGMIGSFFKTPVFGLIAVIVLSILTGACFNHFYVRECIQEIEKIKYRYSGRSMGELKLLCAQNGGTSLLYPVLCILIPFVALILFFALSVIGLFQLIS